MNSLQGRKMGSFNIGRRVCPHAHRARLVHRKKSSCVYATTSTIGNWLTALIQPRVAGPSDSYRSNGGVKKDFLEARQVSLGQLFDASDYVFDIPPYQRPYTWRTKQVFELVQDLVGAYTREEEYFLGAMVAVRSADNTTYDLIDGQQRMTTLMMLLSYVYHRAVAEGDGDLAASTRDMLYVHNRRRYRLQLRIADDDFFQQNMLDAYTPFAYSLVVPSTQEERLPNTIDPELGSIPLSNECWWRLYESAEFISARFSQLEREGVCRAADVILHCLSRCYVVVMTARDELSSFTIFHALNGRGLDLSPVDKLKADLLQILPAAKRNLVADAWAESEAMLGRTAFHAVFDYMGLLAAVAENKAAAAEFASPGLQDYFGRLKLLGPSAVQEVVLTALSYAEILLQLRTGAVVCEGDDTALNALQVQTALMNMFDSDDWMPPTLEFMRQVPDAAVRLEFLRRAEALQLLLELTGDQVLTRRRWAQVTSTVLDPNFSIADVLCVLALTPAERNGFLARLDAKDLAGIVEPRTLKHLLLRAEFEVTSCTESLTVILARGGVSQMTVERILPANPPEGSMWRKPKLSIPGRMGALGGSSHAYWHEMQRSQWQGKLGNLILLPPMSNSRIGLVGPSNDFDEKAVSYRMAGAEILAPEFSGGVAAMGGRYSRHRFSCEECRERHRDLLGRLVQIFRLEEAAEEATKQWQLDDFAAAQW